jgi:hypothetical protein
MSGGNGALPNAHGRCGRAQEREEERMRAEDESEFGSEGAQLLWDVPRL